MYDSLKSFLQPFVQLSEEEFAFLTAHVICKEYPKKHLLIQEGETEQHLYYINKGIIHQYFYKGDEMVTTDIVSEGTITGSVASFLSRKPSHYFLETLEPVTALVISRQGLDALYKSDIKWQRFGRILITHFLLQQELYLLDMIRYPIRERFVRFAATYPELLQRVPQRRLASYLQIEPETFTRLKPLLQEKKKPASKKNESSNNV